MSMAIARAKYTGDPGFFDFLKSAATVATSFIPFVGPTISQAVSRIGSSGPGIGPVGQVFKPGASGRSLAQEQARCTAAGLVYGGRGEGCIQKAPGIAAAFQRAAPGGATGMMRAPQLNGMAMVAGGGYHPNKSDYFLMSGEFVPAGSRMVKNRKRNPANARATSRAISRIAGAKTYAKSLGRISIRKKC